MTHWLADLSWLMFSAAPGVLIAAMGLWLKGAAILLLSLSICHLLHRARALPRYAVLTAAACVVGLLPLLVPVLPRLALPVFQQDVLSPAVSVQYTGSSMVVTEVFKSQRDPVFSPVSAEMLWLSFWLIGSGATAIWLWQGRRRRRRIERVALPARDEIQELGNSLAGELNICPPRVFMSTEAPVPLAVGLFRQRIIIPADAESWPRARLRSMLVHELLHIKRRDTWLSPVAALLLVVHWFNPLAWWLLRRMIFERERTVDQAVVAFGIPQAEYAGHLLATARTLRGSLSTLVASGMAKGPDFKKRLQHILSTDSKSVRQTKEIPMIIALMAVVLSLPIAAWQPWVEQVAPVAAATEEMSHDNPQHAVESSGAERLLQEYKKPEVELPGPPEFPEKARILRREGTVVLGMIVKADGSLENLTVLEETPEDLGFGEAAKDYILSGVFNPATLNGAPVDAHFEIKVTFALSGGADLPEKVQTKEDEIKKPSVSFTGSQPFPEKALAEHIGGEVTLRLKILKDGNWTLEAVEKDVPEGYGFAAAALQYLEQSTWQPGTKNGEPADMIFTLRMRFDLADTDRQDETMEHPIDLEDLTSEMMPELIHRVDPNFPENARKARVDGEVKLSTIIGKDGSVVSVKIVEEDPPGYGFAEEAVQSVQQWRFKPVLLKGKPVSVRISHTVSFNLVADTKAGEAALQEGGDVDFRFAIESFKRPVRFSPFAHRMGMMATGTFLLTIDEMGNVRVDTVLELSREDLLKHVSYIDFLNGLRVKPATRDGVPVPHQYALTLSYQAPPLNRSSRLMQYRSFSEAIYRGPEFRVNTPLAAPADLSGRR